MKIKRNELSNTCKPLDEKFTSGAKPDEQEITMWYVIKANKSIRRFIKIKNEVKKGRSSFLITRGKGNILVALNLEHLIFSFSFIFEVSKLDISIY